MESSLTETKTLDPTIANVSKNSTEKVNKNVRPKVNEIVFVKKRNVASNQVTALCMHDHLVLVAQLISLMVF